MADKTAIEWTDATWNPITGCEVVSTGCRHCYAMRLAAGRLRNHPSRAGLTREGKRGPVWTGETKLNEVWLGQPLRWKRPRRIFVCAHGDLFAESVPDAWIDRVFAVMALAPQHEFQVLTKRAERMHAYVSEWFERLGSRETLVDHPAGSADFQRLVDWTALPSILPNVWLGVSIERQEEADARVPKLLATPAFIRFVSAEPLLGPIDLRRIVLGECAAEFHAPELAGCTRARFTVDALAGARSVGWRGLDWVIAGGESGPDARPTHPDWVRQLRDACTDTGAAFFFKQWGSWGAAVTRPAGTPGRYAITYPGAVDSAGYPRVVQVDHYPRADELFGGATVMEFLGKAGAGRMLDGRTHSLFPAAF